VKEIRGVLEKNQQFLLWCTLASLTVMDIVKMFGEGIGARKRLLLSMVLLTGF